MRSLILTSGLVLGLSGCLVADQTDSGFKTPLSGGTLSGNSKFQVDSGSDTSFVTGNTYGYQAGAIKDEGFQAYAGIVPGASVIAPPASGTATMTGNYEVAYIEDIYVSGQFINGFSGIDRGSLTLNVDFSNGTVSGGNGGLLSVDGPFAGDDLSGSVTYYGVEGPLDGLVGANEAIGVFHGNSDTDLHAGGFIVNP